MKSTRFFWVALVLSLFPVLANAGGSSCPVATPLVADGRITDFDFVAASGTLAYQFTGVAGRSYSIELRQDYDDLNANVSAGLFSDSACGAPITISPAGTSPAVAVDTTGIEPAMPGAATGGGQRFSFSPAATGQFYIKVSNADNTNGHYVSLSISDTTLFDPRWSTSGQNCSAQPCTGFHTEFGVANTTSSTIHVTITLFDKTGTQVTTHGPDAIAPHKAAFYDTRNVSAGVALNMNVSTSGNAILTTDAPPGAVVGDVNVINSAFNGGGVWIQSTKFQTAREGTR